MSVQTAIHADTRHRIGALGIEARNLLIERNATSSAYSETVHGQKVTAHAVRDGHSARILYTVNGVEGMNNLEATAAVMEALA